MTRYLIFYQPSHAHCNTEDKQNSVIVSQAVWAKILQTLNRTEAICATPAGSTFSISQLWKKSMGEAKIGDVQVKRTFLRRLKDLARCYQQVENDTMHKSPYRHNA